MKAEIFEYTVWLKDTEPKTIVDTFNQILSDSGFTVLNFAEHFFTPQGYTALWLLSESHLAVHTFPEESRYYIQLSSCSKEMYDKFISLTNSLDTVIKD